MRSALGYEMAEEFAPYDTFRAQSLAALCAHSYLLQAHILVIQDPESGLATCSKEVEQFAGTLYGKTTSFLVSQIFISVVSAFEVFLQDVLKIVVTRHPKKVGSSTFKLSELLDASSVNSLVERAADEFLYKLMYKKPKEYLKDYCEMLSLDPSPLEVDWATFIEVKARRDLGIHAAWRVNETYIRKISESGVLAERKVGEIALPSGSDYFHSALGAMNKLSDQIMLAVEDKYFKVS